VRISAYVPNRAYLSPAYTVAAVSSYSLTSSFAYISEFPNLKRTSTQLPSLRPMARNHEKKRKDGSLRGC
jgi:hypothetical protein